MCSLLSPSLHLSICLSNSQLCLPSHPQRNPQKRRQDKTTSTAATVHTHVKHPSNKIYSNPTHHPHSHRGPHNQRTIQTSLPGKPGFLSRHTSHLSPTIHIYRPFPALPHPASCQYYKGEAVAQRHRQHNTPTSPPPDAPQARLKQHQSPTKPDSRCCC